MPPAMQQIQLTLLTSPGPPLPFPHALHLRQKSRCRHERGERQRRAVTEGGQRGDKEVACVKPVEDRSICA